MILITVFLLSVVESHCKAHGVSHTEDFCVSAKGTKVGGQCLVFENELMNWKDSVKSCESKGQQLVKLTDPIAFNSFMKKNYVGQFFWLGGSDIKKEGHFVWLDGSPLVNFPWDNNQPDNFAFNQHCLMWGDWGPMKSFDDKSCGITAGYICEIEGYTSHAGDEGGNSKENAIAGDDAEEDARDTGDHNTRAYAGDEGGSGAISISGTGRISMDEALGNIGSMPHAPKYAGDDADHNTDDSEEFSTGAYAGEDGGNSREGVIAGDNGEGEVAADVGVAIVGGSDCPEEKGFFRLPGTQKCYKLFDDIDRSWYQANAKCHQEGLVMATVSDADALELRKLLVITFGDRGTFVWLDARFNGFAYAWNDGTLIGNDNKLWHHKSPSLKPDYCLVLLNRGDFMALEPSRPYWSASCLEPNWPSKALCETKSGKKVHQR